MNFIISDYLGAKELIKRNKTPNVANCQITNLGPRGRSKRTNLSLYQLSASPDPKGRMSLHPDPLSHPNAAQKNQ